MYNLLETLVALNAERAEEEHNGLIVYEPKATLFTRTMRNPHKLRKVYLMS